MAWKVKKDYEGKTVPNCYTPLNDLTQNQIKKLGEKKKKDDKRDI